MQVYMRHLATRKGTRASAGPGPKQATEIVRVKKEARQAAPTILAPPPARVQPDAPRRVVDETRGRLLSEPAPDFFTKVKNRR
jgi:hypothetical protein